MQPFPMLMTMGEKYDPAMKITSQAEANEYFEACVEHTMRACPDVMQADDPRAEAERIERINLGYIAGYYSPETQERVKTLFGAEHPILKGSVKIGV